MFDLHQGGGSAIARMDSMRRSRVTLPVLFAMLALLLQPMCVAYQSAHAAPHAPASAHTHDSGKYLDEGGQGAMPCCDDIQFDALAEPPATPPAPRP